jgi:glycosyltransferase involved in cell wall biosynthesis
MRILHVLPSLDQNYGGPLRAVLDLSTRARAFGLESEILGVGDFSVPDNPFPADLVHSVPLGWPSVYRYAPEMSTWLQSNLSRFDGVVIHGMWLYPSTIVSRICTSLGKRFACFPHGMLEPWSVYGQGRWKAAKKVIYWGMRERGIVKRASAVFYTTERERILAKKAFPIANQSYIVVPYGIDLSTDLAVAPANPRLLQPSTARIALFLGRVHPKKNVDFLIEAWAMARLGTDWRLVIAGPSKDDYATTLHNLIRCRGLEDQISLVGPVAGLDKSYLLHRAQWFLLPSKQENFGIAVLEAIAAGCPVAVSDQVYVSDQFHPKSEVLPLKMDSWVSFLRDRMPDESHRTAIVALDREQLIPRFEINAIARAWAQELTAVFDA